jgi:predicted Zn-dependent protease with MMP-like domain
MTFEEFEATVSRSLEGLPGAFKTLLTKNEIVVLPREKVPAPIKKEHKNQIVFGIFIGLPYGRFTNIQLEPTRIELYKESFEEAFVTPAEIKLQIRKTVVHEVGHYFGFSEEKIREMGY